MIFIFGHFTYTSIHLLEFMIGSSCSLILLNRSFKRNVLTSIAVEQIRVEEPVMACSRKLGRRALRFYTCIISELSEIILTSGGTGTRNLGFGYLHYTLKKWLLNAN